MQNKCILYIAKIEFLNWKCKIIAFAKVLIRNNYIISIMHVSLISIMYSNIVEFSFEQTCLA